MSLYDYVGGLLTIVSGLALTETALRASRLIEYRRTIRWDLLPLLWTLLGIGALVLNWANWWSPDNSMPAGFTIGDFVTHLFANLLLYLTIATALPSDPDRDTDMVAFQVSQRAAFWSLFTLTVLQWDLRYLLLPALQGQAPSAATVAIAAAVLALSVALVFWRNRLFQIVSTVVLVALLVAPLLLQKF